MSRETPIPCTPKAIEFAHRLTDAAQEIVDDLQMNGLELMQGAAIYAGIVAKLQAQEGREEIVARASADIVFRLGCGQSRSN